MHIYTHVQCKKKSNNKKKKQKKKQRIDWLTDWTLFLNGEDIRAKDWLIDWLNFIS